MSELIPQPPELTREDIFHAFAPLIEAYGPIDPSELPDDDPMVAKAYDLYDRWQAQEAALVDSDVPRTVIEYDFVLTTLLVDAGFKHPDYVADVANDWLIQTLVEAEEKGLSELALRIRVKMFELNKSLPYELRQPATEVGVVLEDTLSLEDCAKLATMETVEKSLGYAFSLLIESGVENPEELLKAKGILE